MAVYAEGDFLDGVRAILTRVQLELLPDRLRITGYGRRPLDWPLVDLRALPDHADPAEMVLRLAGHGEERLLLRDAAMIEHLKGFAPNLSRRPPVENKGKILAWATGALASVALIIFVLVPIMAAQLARLLPPEGERALGETVFEQIRSAMGEDFDQPVGLCTAPEGLAALEKMEARLNVEADLPYPVRVSVLDHELENAFALPGGQVVLFRGLIEAAQNPDEVAAVLAHEIGHVVYRDPTRDALRYAGSFGVLGLLFGDFAGGTVMLMLANQMVDASYSQAAETRADEYAHGKLSEAGLPPAAIGTFFERLRAEYGDLDGFAAHLASHPSMTARIEASLAAQAEAEAAGKLTEPALSAAEWQALRAICGGPVRDFSQSSQRKK
ncbi:MAG: peptidase M48 Ste24p [Rhodobacterales bacterium]|nr:MAG: peptidase M48 Ste24p [Rhodobacterales bacterium]